MFKEYYPNYFRIVLFTVPVPLLITILMLPDYLLNPKLMIPLLIFDIFFVWLFLARICYIRLYDDRVELKKGYMFLKKEYIKIYFDKISYVNFSDTYFPPFFNYFSLDFTYFKSGLNQKNFSISLKFIKNWLEFLSDFNSVCKCKKISYGKEVDRIIPMDKY